MGPKVPAVLTAGSAFGTGSPMGSKLLVDDPVPRTSHQSYSIQLADLVAYAAFTANVPPSAGVARLCPAGMWSNIGSATHTAVSGLRPRSKPDIVLRHPLPQCWGPGVPRVEPDGPGSELGENVL